MPRIALYLLALYALLPTSCHRCMALPYISAWVTVTDPDGNAVPDVLVSWRSLPVSSSTGYGLCSADNDLLEHTCGADLHTDEILIEANAPGFESASTTFHLEWGDCGPIARDVTIEMEPAPVVNDLPESACVDAVGEANVGVAISREPVLPLLDDVIDSSEVDQQNAVVRVRIEPRVLAADGSSSAMVTATVSNVGGFRVRGQRVNFIAHEYMEDESGTIYGGLDVDDIPTGSSLRPLPSALLVRNDGLSNSVRSETGDDGTVTVEAVSPSWEDYMLDKPQLLYVWFDTNGGENPVARVFLCFVNE